MIVYSFLHLLWWLFQLSGLGLAQLVLVIFCQGFLCIPHHSVRIIQGCHCRRSLPSVNCLINGDHSCVHWKEAGSVSVALAVKPQSKTRSSWMSEDSQAASSTDSSLARIPPILLKAGIWMPYLSSSLLMWLISSSGEKKKKQVKLLYKATHKRQLDSSPKCSTLELFLCTQFTMYTIKLEYKQTLS